MAPRHQARSFESLEAILTSQGSIIRIVTYRPPPSKKNKLSVSLFFEEFAEFMADAILKPGKLLLIGDFNFHWDVPKDPGTTQLTHIFQSHGLKQHVTDTTHISGHILDLVACNDTESIIENITVSSLLSDHFAIHFQVNIGKPISTKKVLSYRKIRDIDQYNFMTDIVAAEINADDIDLNDAVDKYNKTIATLLNKHAPLKSRKVTVRTTVPWYNEDLNKKITEKMRTTLASI